MSRRRLSFRHFVPLVGFVVPTLGIGYGFVIPRSCIAGINELTRASRSRSPAPASAIGLDCARSRATRSRRDEARVDRASVALRAVDASDVMVRLATRRLRERIERGQVDVRRAEAARLPFEPARFDAALVVHVVYFWPDAKVELREIRRVLRPGGVLVIGFRPDDLGARAGLPGSVYHLRSATEVEKVLREVGFDEVEVATTSLGRVPFVCLRASAANTGAI